MKTAKMLRQLPRGRRGYHPTGQGVYELSPPMIVHDSRRKDHAPEHCMGDANGEGCTEATWVVVKVAQPLGVPQTSIFMATQQGDVVDKDHRLPGSFIGGMDGRRALRDAGYTVEGF